MSQTYIMGLVSCKDIIHQLDCQQSWSGFHLQFDKCLTGSQFHGLDGDTQCSKCLVRMLSVVKANFANLGDLCSTFISTYPQLFNSIYKIYFSWSSPITVRMVTTTMLFLMQLMMLVTCDVSPILARHCWGYYHLVKWWWWCVWVYCHLVMALSSWQRPIWPSINLHCFSWEYWAAAKANIRTWSFFGECKNKNNRKDKCAFALL